MSNWHMYNVKVSRSFYWYSVKKVLCIYSWKSLYFILNLGRVQWIKWRDFVETASSYTSWGISKKLKKFKVILYIMINLALRF